MPRADATSAEVVRPPVSDPLAGTSFFLWVFRACVYGLLVIAWCLGGPFIRAAAIAGAFFALFGDRAGAVRHTLHLLALPVALVLAHVLGVRLGGWVAGAFGVSVPLALVIGIAVTVVATLLVTTALGRALTRRLRRHRYLYVLNRTGGSLLGVGEGVLIVAVFCWVIGLFGPSIHLCSQSLPGARPRLAQLVGHFDAMREALLEDPAGRWVARANPLRNVPSVATLVAAAEATADSKLFWQAHDDGCFDELLANPVVRKHLGAFRSDPDIRRAVKERDVGAIFSSWQFAAALSDDELCAIVAEHWPEVRARISDSQIARARRLVGQLDGAAKARVQDAIRRAEQFGIQLP